MHRQESNETEYLDVPWIVCYTSPKRSMKTRWRLRWLVFTYPFRRLFSALGSKSAG
jgi:hypothetical protein